MYHTEAIKSNKFPATGHCHVFNEHDSTKLEEWLMDKETAADLTE